MRSNKCRCQPDGGGISCPDQCIALCIRGRTGGCNGTCIPIPRQYNRFSVRFENWVDAEIHNEVLRYALGANFPGLTEQNFNNYFKKEKSDFQNRGRIIFTSDQAIKIIATYNVTFVI